jgi:hypothetical protein
MPSFWARFTPGSYTFHDPRIKYYARTLLEGRSPNRIRGNSPVEESFFAREHSSLAQALSDKNSFIGSIGISPTKNFESTLNLGIQLKRNYF